MTRPSNQKIKCEYCKDKQGGCERCDTSYSFAFLVAALVNCLVIYGLFWIASGVLKDSESPSPTQFFITTLLSLLVLNAIVFQILVSQRQWKVMNQQGETMQRQLDVMERSLKLSDDTFYLSQRAYLTVEGFVFDGELEMDSTVPVVIEILVKNSGQTPAKNATLSFAAAFIELPEPKTRPKPPFGLPEKAPIDIAAQTTRPITIDFIPSAVPSWGRGDHLLLHILLRYETVGDRVDGEMGEFAYVYHPENPANRSWRAIWS